MAFSKIFVFTQALVSFTNAGCEKFSSVYATPQELPSVLWYGAFTYETDESKAYSMWFEDPHNNPNDAFTKKLIDIGAISNTAAHFDDSGQVDRCYLDVFHKNASELINNTLHPGEDPDNFDICKPWAERGCCASETMNSVEDMRTRYNDVYNWGTCGNRDNLCEQFYVEELCFYECSPNAGLYRRYRESDEHAITSEGQELFDSSDDSHDKWSMFGMPMKASYWDAYYAACKDEYICVGKDESCLNFVAPEESGIAAEAAVALATAAAATAATAAADATDAAAAVSTISIIGLICGVLGLLFGAYAVYLVKSKRTQYSATSSDMAHISA